MVCVRVPKDCHDAKFQDLNRRVLRVYDVTKTKTHAMLVYPDTQRGVQGVDGDEVRLVAVGSWRPDWSVHGFLRQQRWRACVIVPQWLSRPEPT